MHISTDIYFSTDYTMIMNEPLCLINKQSSASVLTPLFWNAFRLWKHWKYKSSLHCNTRWLSFESLWPFVLRFFSAVNWAALNVSRRINVAGWDGTNHHVDDSWRREIPERAQKAKHTKSVFYDFDGDVCWLHNVVRSSSRFPFFPSATL